ncbi:MAG TPA: amidohydrolase family protein, partial [bacterium]|nr:amidohydrolase family protein [bacterium]
PDRRKLIVVRVDIAAHILPARYFARLQQIPGFYLAKRVKGVPGLFDLNVRFRIMDGFDAYQQVLSLASPPLDRLGSPEVTPDLARLANDELAGLVAAHPDRFAGALGGLPLNNPDASLRELDRLARLPGFVGVQIYSNVAGRPLDEPRTLEVVEEAARRRMAIFLHPARGADFPDYPGEEHSLYDLWQIFGWPYETTIAMARLIFTGLFDRHPDAVIITHHMGGLVPHFADRIRGGYDQFGTRGPEHQVETFPVALAHPPAWYFPRFYADTALFGAPHAVRCGLAYFPVERVLFGTDTPFDAEGGTRYIRETIAALDQSGLPPDRRQMVDEGNLRRVLARRQKVSKPP